MADLKHAFSTAPVLIETTFKGNACLPCVYMEAVVRNILPVYGHRVSYQKVEISLVWGKKRFLELSCALFGEDGVYKHHRIAPLPALFINGELIFDAIPSRDELEAAIDGKVVSTSRVLSPDQVIESFRNLGFC